MKTRVPRLFFGAFALGSIFLLAQNVQSQILYSDTNTSQNGNFNYFTNEAGNEVSLYGGSPTYLITNFVFQFDLVNSTGGVTGTPNGAEKAQLRFYANNGPNVAGFPSPGTLLFDSGAFSIGGFTTGTTATFNQAALNGGVVVPWDFTWTVTFSGLGTENAGLALYSPATVGTNYNDAWVRAGTGSWGLNVATFGNPPLDFASVASGASYFESYTQTNVIAITINNDTVNGGKAVNGYPSTVTVPASVSGTLQKATVTLNGFTHPYPNDVVLLLVAPNGYALPLMGNDGGGIGVTNYTLTFDDDPGIANATAMGISAPITNNWTYRSGDNAAFGTTVQFPAPAPATNQPNLTAFNNLLPASYTGVWSLYVLDDSQPGTGSIASWALNLYTEPVIQSTSNAVTVTENQSATFYFTVSDSASNSTITAGIGVGSPQTLNTGYGANTTVLTPADFVFGTLTNNGTNSVTITPNPNLYGTADFTIFLTNGTGAVVPFGAISVTINHVAPFLSPLISLANSTITTSLGVASTTNLISLISLDGNGGAKMGLTVLATNVNLLNVGVNSNVFTNISGVSNPINGNTNSFNFSIVPGGFPIGTSYLNFIATDSFANKSVTQLVTVIVTPFTNGALAGPLVSANTNSLIVAANSASQLSPITFTNLTALGPIGKVTVSVLGLTNIVPSGLALELVAPDGTVVPLIGTVSGANATTFAELTFSDSTGLPNVNGHDALPAPAANAGVLTNYALNSTGGATAFTTLLGGHSPTNTGANNFWTLYVTNNSGASLGISGGWELTISPMPVLQEPVQTATLTIPESATTNVVFVTSDTVGSQSGVAVSLNPATTATYNSNALATATSLANGATAVINGTTYTVGSAIVSGTNYTTNIVKLTGNYNEAGTVAIPVIVSEVNAQKGAAASTFTATNTLTLNVTFVAQPPTISFIENQVTYAGGAVLNVPFVISSPDTNAGALTVTIASANQALLPTTGTQNNALVTRGPSTGQPPTSTAPTSPSLQTNYISLFPIGVKGGQSLITVSVSDGQNTVSNQFNLIVGAPGSPLIYNSTPINIGTVNSSGSPYGSTNLVSGLLGKLENVVVTVFDVSEPNNAAGLSLLLVGPASAAGQSPAVYLIGDVGGPNVGLTNANLIFSNSLSGPVNAAGFPPQIGQIPSTNIYQPTNYGNYYNNGTTYGSAYTYPAPAPAPAPPGGGSYSSNLVTAFSGINPNGPWTLYAFDTNGVHGGAIFGGWQLSIVTAPNISVPTTNYSTPENVPTNIVIQVGDAEAGNTSFAVTAVVSASGSSSVPSISVVSPLTITNNGVANLAVLQVTPNPYQFGTNNILVTATDAGGSISTTNLQFIVTQVPQAPIILVTNLTVSTPAAVATNGIPFAVWDVQTTNQNTVAISITGMSPAPMVTVITNATVGGTNSYALNIQPVGVGAGSATINVAVTDGVGQTAKVNFTLTVTSNLVFASTTGITTGSGYPVQALSSSYPWSITVPTNVAGGLVSGVQVELFGFNHTDASDVDILLVSPDGKHSVVLMANAGGQLPATNINLTFSQSAGGAVPQFSQLANGASYLPGNYLGSLVFSNNPAPTPYSANLTTAFAGLQPSGTWNLYVMDSAFPDSGSIASWILFLQTGPAIAAIPNQGVAENGSVNVPLTLIDTSTAVSNLVVYITNANSANLTVTPQGAGTPSGVTNLLIVPAANYPSTVQNINSTNTISVAVYDPNNNIAWTSFTLVVTNIPQMPVIVSVSPNNLVMAENAVSVPITFTVSNIDASLSPSGLNLISTNTALVVNNKNGITTNSTIASPLTAGTAGTVTYWVTPVANVFGTNAGALVFTVGNTNHLTNTVSVNLSISHVVQNPTMAAFFSGSYALSPGTTSTNITFTAGTVESNAVLNITASSGTPSEIPSSANNIIISQTSFTNAVPGVNSGTVTIIVPAGTPAGSSIIYVTNTQVIAGSPNLATVASFTIQVLASPTTTFANLAPIANTAGNPKASPYGSTNVVSSLIGNVLGATVTLNSLSAGVPSDVSILLEAPNGASVLLLSGAGGTNPSANLTLTFADSNALASATAPLQTNGGFANYHPTSYNGETTALPLNAPAPPYYDRMSQFNGINPNGSWVLWVVDTTTGDTASIANGWTLALTTTPLIALDSPPSPFNIPENAAGQTNSIGTLTFHVVDSTGGTAGDTVTVTAAPSSLFLTPTFVSTFTSTLSNDYTATFTPVALSNGAGTLTFTVTRPSGASAFVTYPVTVVQSNIAPTLTRLGPITTNENQTGQTTFLVTQLGDPLSTVTVAVYSSNTAVLANSGITFTAGPTDPNAGTLFKTNVANLSNFASSVPNSGELTINMAPVHNQVGTATVAVFVTNADGAFNSPTITSTNFTFTVTATTFNPTFAGVPASPVSVTGGNTANINFQVNSLDFTPPLVTVSAVNQNAPNGVTVSVAPAVPTVAGSTWTATVTTVPTTTQVASTIQLTATDANNLTANASFQVLSVPSVQHYYSNTTPINIVDVSPSIPSPSSITVSGLVGLISQVIVTVNGFGHQYPSDVGMLLVGPGGSNSVLMNYAGGGANVAGLNLTFSSNAAGPLPASATLTSGTYLPSDYQPVKPYNFLTSGPNNPTPPNPLPPSGPYPTNLTVFNGLNPNATWNLYVQDDSAGDTGLVANGQGVTGGWTLQIFTQPTLQITGLTSITNAEGPGSAANGKTSFIILDDSPVAVANYTSSSFGVTSSNTTLLPTANVTFTGSGTNWTANFSPIPFVVGTSLVTIYSTNSYGQVASASFQVTVTAVNFPPVVSQPAPGSVLTIPASTPSTIALVYSDTGYNTNALVVSATSIPLGSVNPIPSSSLAFVANGTGPSNLVITPVGNLTGSNLITVTVAQPAPGVSSTNTSFTVVVVPSTVPVFVNTNTITINANSAASPYPSQIPVSGVGANILKVTVTLLGFTHSFPSDVSALLVGPTGKSVMLMSAEGGGVGVSNLRLTFDDAGGTMAANGPLTSGNYAPANSDLSVPDITNFTSVLAPPYGHALSVFSNTSPIGVWSLYVFDNNQPDTGLIVGGWSLSIQTIGPMITPLNPVTMNENTVLTIPYSVASATTYASNISVAVSSSSQVPAGLISSLVVSGAGSSNQTLTITPTTNFPSAVTNIDGTTTITLVLTDTNHNASTNSFPLTVFYVLVPPTITLPVTQTNTPANVALAVPFKATDVEGVTNLIVSATVSPNLGTVAVTFNGGPNFTLVFTPNGVLGTATVTVTASDHGAASSLGVAISTSTFQLTTTAGLPPTITIVSATNTPENSTISVPVSLGLVPTNFSSLNLSASWTNTNLVASVSFSGAGSNMLARVTLVQYVTGTNTFNVTVTNQYGSASTSFALTVTPVEFPPTLAPIPDTNTTANTPLTLVLNVTDYVKAITNLTFKGAIASTNVIKAVNFSFNGTNELATIVPVSNAIGASLITISVSDGVATNSQSFAIYVTHLEFPPTLAPIPDTNTPANTAVTVVLHVTDPVTSITNLFYSAYNWDTNVVGAVSFSFNGTNEIVTIVPATNKIGEGDITINVSDGFTNVYQFFDVFVTAPTPPTLGPISNQFTAINTAIQIPLSVTSPVTPVTNLQFSGSSSNANFVNKFTFSFNGTNEVAAITPVPNATGVGTITISVNDLFTTNSQSFALQVNPATGPTLSTTLGENVTITFTGMPGGTYNIQSSPNLTTWTTIATVTANAVTGVVSYQVVVPFNTAGHTFYRLQLP